MKNGLIHRGFYREMMRQLRTKGIVFMCILASINILSLMTVVFIDPILESSTSAPDARAIAAPMLLLTYVMGMIMVFGAYRWLNTRAQSDFYHAIPLSRAQIYTTTSAAVLGWLFLALVSYAALQAILYLVFRRPYNYLLLLCVLVNMLIAAIEIVAAFSIACALTGRRFVTFFQGLAVLFLPRILLGAFWILVELDSGFTTPFSLLPFFLNPEFNIAATPIHSLIYGINFANLPAMLYSLIYSVGLLLLGMLVFQKRKSEASDIPYTSKVMQTATRVAIGMIPLALVILICNLYVRYYHNEEFVPVYIAVPLFTGEIIFSFFLYFIYELISSKKMKKVAKALPFYGLCVAAALFYIFVPALIGRVYPHKTVNAERIVSYRISNESTLIIPNNILGNTTYSDYVLEHYAFTDEDGKYLIAEQSEKNADKDNSYDLPGLTFQKAIVKDGGLFRTVVSLPDTYRNNAYEELLDLCEQNEGFRKELSAFPKGLVWYSCEGLTNAEAKEVGKLFREDYEKLSTDERLKLIRTEDTIFYSPSTSLHITLSVVHGTDSYSASYDLNELTPNAVRRFNEIINERNEKEVRNELKKIVRWMEKPDRYRDYSFTLYIDNQRLNDYMVWDSSDREKYTCPKDAHPAFYQMLKALSEAPAAIGSENCVRVQVIPFGRSNAFITDVVASFEVDASIKELIDTWIRTRDEPGLDSASPYDNI